MTYNPIIFNERSSASKVNANWVHAGRFGFSSFYGMDIDGNYVSQDLGEQTKKWKDLYLSGIANIANIKISGNTIESTDTDGDIDITPNGDGNCNITTNGDINLDSGDGRTKISRLIGSTGSEQSYTNIRENLVQSATVQATKDLIVNIYKFVYDYKAGSGNNQTQVIILSDSNATPTTVIAGWESPTYGIADATTYLTISFPVKKGNYYKIQSTNNTTNSDVDTTLYWRETEIGV